MVYVSGVSVRVSVQGVVSAVWRATQMSRNARLPNADRPQLGPLIQQDQVAAVSGNRESQPKFLSRMAFSIGHSDQITCYSICFFTCLVIWQASYERAAYLPDVAFETWPLCADWIASARTSARLRALPANWDAVSTPISLLFATKVPSLRA